MFGWFKKKPKVDAPMPGFLEDMFRPLSLATAVAQVVAEHQKNINPGADRRRRFNARTPVLSVSGLTRALRR